MLTAASDDTSVDGPDVPGRDPTPSAPLHDEDRRRLMQEALACLADPLDREIVLRNFFEAESLTKIKDRLGVSLDRARLGFHRGLERLRPHLDALR